MLHCVADEKEQEEKRTKVFWATLEKKKNKDQMSSSSVCSLNEETLYYNHDLNFCFPQYI